MRAAPHNERRVESNPNRSAVLSPGARTAIATSTFDFLTRGHKGLHFQPTNWLQYNLYELRVQRSFNFPQTTAQSTQDSARPIILEMHVGRPLGTDQCSNACGRFDTRAGENNYSRLFSSDLTRGK